MEPDFTAILLSIAEPAQFVTVFDEHYDRMYRYVARRLGPDAAAELTSEIFLRAYEARSSFDPTKGAPISWLYGIAFRVVAERKRLRYKDATRFKRSPRSDAIYNEDYAAVDSRIDASQRYSQTLEALDSLQDAEQEILILVAWEELSYNQIAEVLSCPVGTVRSRLSRARSALRAALQETTGKTRELDPASLQLVREQSSRLNTGDSHE